MIFNNVYYNQSTLDNCTAANGTVTRTDSANEWTSKAQSSGNITAGDSIEIRDNSSSSIWRAGLGVDPFGSTSTPVYEPDALEFCWQFNPGNNKWYVIESDVLRVTVTSNASAVGTIETNSSGQIVYKLNGNTEYTSSSTLPTGAYVHVVMKGLSSVNVKTDSDQIIPVDSQEGVSPLLDYVLKLRTVVPR